MGNSAALIYAAGVGSRMKKITENTSKCIIDLDGVMPIEHTIKSFVGCGIDNLIIVIGYYARLVQEKIQSILGSWKMINMIFMDASILWHVHMKKWQAMIPYISQKGISCWMQTM